MAGGRIEIPGRRKPSRSSRELWAGWTLATTLGELLGFAVPASAGVAAVAAGAPDPALVGIAVAAGTAEGAVLGAAQSVVLRGEQAAGRAVVLAIEPRRK